MEEDGIDVINCPDPQIWRYVEGHRKKLGHLKISPFTCGEDS